MKATIRLTCEMCPARVSETYDNAEPGSDERAQLHVERRAITANFRRIPAALPYRRWDAWLCTDCARDVRKVLDGEKPDGAAVRSIEQKRSET